MYMMLSRLGKGVPHLDACMLALGTKQNKDMMVHMHPIECAWMLAVGTKQNTDLVVLMQPRATSLVRLASTAQCIFSPYFPVMNSHPHNHVCTGCRQHNSLLWRDKMRPART